MDLDYWQIWVDTGGTFTDCIAIHPNGTKERIKVLSSGCLRGTITESTGPNQYRIAQKWNGRLSIFEGYFFTLLNKGDFSAKILAGDDNHSTFELSASILYPLPIEFEISANEEAPILAARMATNTPLHEDLPMIKMRLGSTKGTNALLERKGAKVTLLTTKGFADLLKIGTQQRPDLFQLCIPEPTVLFDQVLEIEEYINPNGEVINPISPIQLAQVIDRIQHPTIAIALLNAYKNPIHELRLMDALKNRGFHSISVSHILSPTVKLLPRAQTAVINAYLSPVINNYLQQVVSKLNAALKHQLLVMTSAGGLNDANFFLPKDSLLSGPAGGITGAATIAHLLGYEKVLTLDMGGTSTDTSRFDGVYDYQFRTKINDIEMSSPSLAIETVAAGGGSICSFDGLKLCVGPESAGALPGPACYGTGGPLTITDVNILLGKMDPSFMGIPIKIEAAYRALEKIKAEVENQSGVSISEKELLLGFEQIANQKMSEAIRKISVAKGFDPKQYALVAFGGAGGIHSGPIAENLGIQKIILPFDGGLLSAWGMGQANIERFIEKQVNLSLDEFMPLFDQTLHEIAEKAFQLLIDVGFERNALFLKNILLYLRFWGQDQCLEILYHDGLDLKQAFEKKFTDLFGYFPENRSIEVESLKIIVSNSNNVSFIPSPVDHYYAPTQSYSYSGIIGSYPVYIWKELLPGARIEGPAILANETSSAFIETGWDVTIGFGQNAVCSRRNMAADEKRENIEAIDLELFKNRFSAIADEMGNQLQRTAFSVNIKERLDFSCAILNQHAKLLVNAPHIPVHLGSLGVCAEKILEVLSVGPEDLIITNHPKFGGSHLPDVTLLSGVFDDTGVLIGYVINRAHHAEIGGARPGSMPPSATSLEEEGVIIPPMYLVKKGIPNWNEIIHLLKSSKFPSRAVEENLADIMAAVASIHTGRLALKKLAKDFGTPTLHYFMNKLHEISKNALIKAIRKFEGKTFKATEVLDDGHEICVKIDIKKSKISFSFDGTSGPHPGNLNANLSIVYSAIIYVLRLLCNEPIPLNGGIMEVVDIKLPTSFLNPDFDSDSNSIPAVVGGNTEVSQRLVDTLLKALKLAACSQGTMNNFLFGNDHFGYYETIGGGVGATEGCHGRSATHQHMTNTKITDPEDLEARYPVRLIRFEIRTNSGGAGQWKGGDGIIREFEFLEKVEATLLSQHRKSGPYGLEGGAAGKPGEQYVLRTNGWREYLSGSDSITLNPGDRITIKTPGGGGWGAAASD